MVNIFLKFNQKRATLRDGFTLLEILIVIAIIGILVSIGVASYSTAQTKARDSARRSDMKAVQTAFEQYYADSTNAAYPAAGCSISATYLPGGLPTDPKNVAPYVYAFTCTTSTYCFCAELEQSSANNSDSSCNFQAATKDHFCVANLQ